MLTFKYQKFFTKIAAVIICSFIAGCTSKPPSYKTDTKKEGGMPLHGNFCGNNVPTIEEEDMAKRIDILKSIEPIDEIDAACKRHDICYAEKGYFNDECDDGIYEDMVDKLSKNYKPISCRRLVSHMHRYFGMGYGAVVNAFASSEGDIVGKIIFAPVMVVIYSVATVADTALLIVTNSVTYLLALATGTFKEGEDNLKIFPSRYEKCKLVDN